MKTGDDTLTGKPRLRRLSDAPAQADHSMGTGKTGKESVNRLDAIKALERVLWRVQDREMWTAVENINLALGYLRAQRQKTP